MKNYINCIYMYINKNNGKKYIGQTVDFNRRHKQHINASLSNMNGYDENTPIHRAMRKYGIDNFEIVILKQDLSDQEELNYWESFYIKEYNTLYRNGMGYNVSSGGSYGNPYAGKTEEEMKKISKKKSESRKGIKFTEEHKKHISENSYMKNIPSEQHPFYGKHHSEEANEKNKQAHIGKHHTEETKEQIKKTCTDKFGVKILQYDKQGNLIKTWNSVKEASRETGIDQSSIRKCLSKERKSSGGYVWIKCE